MRSTAEQIAELIRLWLEEEGYFPFSGDKMTDPVYRDALAMVEVPR